MKLELTAEQVAAIKRELEAKPELPNIFECKEGEHKGKWFRRTGDNGSFIPSGDFFLDGRFVRQVPNAQSWTHRDFERLELLPPIEVGQKWRCHTEFMANPQIRPGDTLRITSEHMMSCNGYAYGCVPQYLYASCTIIPTCPACGQECDEPATHCKKHPATPPRPSDQFFDGEWWTAKEFFPVRIGEYYWNTIRNGITKAQSNHWCESWIMVRKWPDTITADEFVQERDFAGAKATRRDTLVVVLNGMVHDEDEPYWSLYGTGIHGITFLSRPDSNMDPHEGDTTSITLPTGETYRCDGGKLTRVRDNVKAFKIEPEHLQVGSVSTRMQEPALPQVGDDYEDDEAEGIRVGDVVECIKSWPGISNRFVEHSRYFVSGDGEGMAAIMDHRGHVTCFGEPCLSDHFRVARNAGAK